MSDFATQLNALFDRWQIDHGRLLTNREVAERATAHGYRISASYLSRLRNGNRENPSAVVLSGLARVFRDSPDPRLTPGYTAAVCSDDQLIAEVTDLRLRRLLRVADGLSLPTFEILIMFSDKLRRAEGRLGDPMESLAALLRTFSGFTGRRASARWK
ncbi:transcriptional regulator [Nocardia colli]|uniref:transcriptional regulator n=1 Tax=Nocardia colli TaxID=2545717 RepID=UPI0035E2D0C3